VRGILIPPHSNDLSLPDFDWSQFSVVRSRPLRQAAPRAHCHQRPGELRRHGLSTGSGSGVTAASLTSPPIGFERNTGGNFRAGYLSAQDVHVPLRRHLAPFTLSEEHSPADVRALRKWLRTAKPDAIITALANLHELLDQAGCRVPGDIGSPRSACSTAISIPASTRIP